MYGTSKYSKHHKQQQQKPKIHFPFIFFIFHLFSFYATLFYGVNDKMHCIEREKIEMKKILSSVWFFPP